MFEMVKNEILNYVDMPAESITEETEFIKDLGMNSYDFICIIGNLEDNLGIEIPESDLLEMRTIGDIVAYLKDRV